MLRRFTDHAIRWTLLVVLVSAPPECQAENWPGFRGTGGDGVASASLPLKWSATENIDWKTPIPGFAWSQPIVWENDVFLTTVETEGDAIASGPQRGDWSPGVSGLAALFGTVDQTPARIQCRWKLICLDLAKGTKRWERVVHDGSPTIRIHRNNSYATETPVTDGSHVISCFGMTAIVCCNRSGDLLWKKELGVFPMQLGWGTGSSPVLHEGLVYIQCDNDKASFLLALDAATGNERWRVERQERSNWSTPYIWKNRLRTELVTAGGSKARAYDPATGELFWEIQGSGRAASSPVGDAECVYFESADRLTGRSGQIVAIRAGADGDVTLKSKETTSEAVAWSVRVNGNRVASPVLLEGRLYIVEQPSAIIHCLDANTGAELYRHRVPKASGFTASPWTCDGKVYLLDELGQTFVLESASDFKLLATNVLEGEMTWGSPAVVGARLLIRGQGHLYCVTKAMP